MKKRTKATCIILHFICILIFITLYFKGLKGVFWKLYYLSFLVFNVIWLIKACKLKTDKQLVRESGMCEQCFHNFNNKCTRISLENGKFGVCWFEEEY